MTPPTITAPGTIVSLMLYGSHAHGTATPTSNEDWRGVFQLENEEFLGLSTPVQTYEQKPDIVLWEVAQFARLLLKGNPNIVGMLWVPDDCVHIDAPPMTVFREIREQFITKPMLYAYLSWARSELGRALTPKQLSHVPRLMWEIEGAMLTRNIPVRLPYEKRRIILDIKTGVMPMAPALELARALLRRVEELETRISLPEAPRKLVEEIVWAARD